jgi:hypothetical protein
VTALGIQWETELAMVSGTLSEMALEMVSVTASAIQSAST